MRELDALGHTCTFSDSDGRWVVWASCYLVASWNPGADGRGSWTCRVALDASVIDHE